YRTSRPGCVPADRLNRQPHLREAASVLVQLRRSGRNLSLRPVWEPNSTEKRSPGSRSCRATCNHCSRRAVISGSFAAATSPAADQTSQAEDKESHRAGLWNGLDRGTETTA